MRHHLFRKRPLGHAGMTRFDFIMLVAVCSTALVTAVMAKDARHPRMSEVYASLGCSAQYGRCAHTIKRIMDDGSVHANATIH